MTRENYEKATQDYKNIEKNERVINLLKKATEMPTKENEAYILSNIKLQMNNDKREVGEVGFDIMLTFSQISLFIEAMEKENEKLKSEIARL
jgi:hypothetical protein